MCNHLWVPRSNRGRHSFWVFSDLFWAYLHAFNLFSSLPATYHYVRVVLVFENAVLGSQHRLQ